MTPEVLENEIKHLNNDMDEIKADVKAISLSIPRLEASISNLANRTLWDMVDRKTLITLVVLILLSGASLGERVWSITDRIIAPAAASIVFHREIATANTYSEEELIDIIMADTGLEYMLMR